MHVIFLDLSGTLDPIANRPDRSKEDVVDRLLVALVNRIAEATGAKVVISSDWVADPENYLWVCEMLVQHGLVPEIIGQTTQPFGEATVYYRPRHILNWLDLHPEVTNYVILDDLRMPIGLHRWWWAEQGYEITDPDSVKYVPDIPGMDDHFVYVDAMIGLTEADAERAIAILGS